MDNLWDIKSFEVAGHWPLWWGWKTEWPRWTHKCRTLKQHISYLICINYSYFNVTFWSSSFFTFLYGSKLYI